MTDQARYRAVFQGIESALIRAGNLNSRTEDIRKGLDVYKGVSQKTFSDDDYYRLMVHVAFYSGFKAVTVDERLDVINAAFADYRRVAEHGSREFDTIRSTPGMISNRAKITACIENAKEFRDVVRLYGSFDAYIRSFEPSRSFDNVMKLRRNLRRRFAYLSKITSYHFLTDIGMPVLKPDRVVRRISHRLGFIPDTGETEERLAETVQVGQEFADATGLPIRYIDIVFVAFGQVKGNDPDGLPQGICLEKSPQCSRCDVTAYCQDFQRRMGKARAQAV